MVLISPAQLTDLVREIVQSENESLRKLVATVREELRKEKQYVLSLRQAVSYFDYDVKPETLRDYIWYCGLPAFKRGRLYFVYRSDLFDFQIGRIGHPSTKKIGVKNIVRPRHHDHEQRSLQFGVRDRSPRHALNLNQNSQMK